MSVLDPACVGRANQRLYIRRCQRAPSKPSISSTFILFSVLTLLTGSFGVCHCQVRVKCVFTGEFPTLGYICAAQSKLMFSCLNRSYRLLLCNQHSPCFCDASESRKYGNATTSSSKWIRPCNKGALRTRAFDLQVHRTLDASQ